MHYHIIVVIRQKHQRLLESIKQEQERHIRQKTAEDFHDEMGNRITRIGLLTNVLKLKVVDADNETNRILEQIKENAQQLYYGTNDIIWSLNTESKNLHDTIKRIASFGNEMFGDSSINFSIEGWNLNLEKIKLTSEQSRNIIMIFKESINNALKYSKAKNVQLSVVTEKDSVIIILKDDGIGFNVSLATKGHGLSNMKKRSERMQTDLKIVSEGNGTSVQLKFIIA